MDLAWISKLSFLIQLHDHLSSCLAKGEKKGGTHKTALNPYLQEKTRNFKALLITDIVYNDFIESQNEVLTVIRLDILI